MRALFIRDTLPPGGPLRSLAVGALVTSVGNGAWYTAWAVFLTRSVGLSPGEVGLGMTAGGVLGMLLATPVGHLADRLGPREVFLALLVLQGLGAVAWLAVDGLGAFLVVACVTVGVAQGRGGARNALVVGLAAGEAERLRALGALRVASHLGWALGAAAGAIVVGVDTRAAYVALILLDAATYLAYAVQVARVPRVAPVPRAPVGARLTVLRDRPYVTLAGLMGVLALCWAMLSSALPLWIAFHTQAPVSIAAVIVAVNSLAIAALQVPVTRAVPTPLRAARAAVWSGTSLAAACALFAATEGLGGAGAVALLLAGGVAHVAGELLFVAASWGLSLPLMPAGASGQYQGMFSAGEATAQTVAPVLMTTVVVGWGSPGWLALGALFLLAVSVAPPATRWALRTRTLSPAAA